MQPEPEKEEPLCAWKGHRRANCPKCELIIARINRLLSLLHQGRTKRAAIVGANRLN